MRFQKAAVTQPAYSTILAKWSARFPPRITAQCIMEMQNRLESNSWQYPLCSLIIYEMDIKKHVDLDASSEKLCGFASVVCDRPAD